MKYFNHLGYTEQFENMKDMGLIPKPHKPNPNKCRKGHNYVNNICINCDRELKK